MLQCAVSRQISYSSFISLQATNTLTHRSYGSEILMASGWAPGVLGVWGEWLFIFRELGSTDNYFQGFGEQARSFGDLESPGKSKKNISPSSKSLYFV